MDAKILSQNTKTRWFALAFVGISLLCIAMDNTLLNLALPSIAKELGSSDSALQWIVTSYILIFAGLLLTMGCIGDRYGRKRTLQLGLLLFAGFSLGAAASHSTGMLIVMRALMGVGAAMIMPSTLSILTTTFQDRNERAQAIALWAGVFALGMGIGPLVGGWLLEHFNWNSIFYINSPIVIAALVGGKFFIEESKSDNPRKIDVTGSILSIAGLLALVYGIIQAGVDGWTATEVLISLVTAIILLIIFALWEAHSPHPMLPMKFFKNLSFTGASLALTLVSFGLVGVFFFLGQYLQSVCGYSALQSGIRLLPLAITAFIAAGFSARLVRHIGTKFTVGMGILTAGIGFFILSRIIEATPDYSHLILGLCITSLGIGFTLSPATNSVMGSVPANEAGIGSAMNDTTRQIGGALGVAVVGSLANSIYLRDLNSMKGLSQLPAQFLNIIRSSIQGAHIVAGNINNPLLSQEIIQSADKAFLSGVSFSLFVAAIIMIVTSMVTIIILPSRVQNSTTPMR